MSGLRSALEEYIAEVYPAGPDPMMITFSTAGVEAACELVIIGNSETIKTLN
jgi:hypothetical protein